MKSARTKSDHLIVMAVKAGYTANKAGSIFAPDGRSLKGGTSRHGHKNFIPNVVDRAGRSSVLQHRFIMYYFNGAELFKHAVVRHLNDVPADNRLENLAFGSVKDNRNDIPKVKLSLAAKKHAASLINRSRKLSDADVLAMRVKRATTAAPYHRIASEFGVTTMTAYRAVNKQCWVNL